MEWKLWTLDQNVSPPMRGSMSYPSLEAALDAADSKIPLRHVKILSIETPDGSMLELQQIEHLIQSKKKKPPL
jgi:hypothetical protein